MKILMYKNTTDADLSKGLKVCYQNLQGVYNNFGTIEDITEQDGVKLYSLNTAMGLYAANELKLIAPPELNTVKVLFADSQYNYSTDVSAQTTEQSANSYFKGKTFDVGSYPKENYQTCIGIEFTNNN